VLAALRGAKHRDLIHLEQRPAASAQDLINGINDHRPHVVHFSGHSGEAGLYLDNSSLLDGEGRTLSFDVLAELLGATDEPPTLVVLNSCRSLTGAERLLQAAPVIIAMADTVGDAAAGVFATQFYSAIASAQSVGAALRQAKAMMKAALLEDAEVVEHVSHDDIDIDNLQLVKPV
jgi:CHAT domain-containing protein